MREYQGESVILCLDYFTNIMISSSSHIIANEMFHFLFNSGMRNYTLTYAHVFPTFHLYMYVYTYM